MAKIILQTSLPAVTHSQKFNLEVEVTESGLLNITLPQQTVKATKCYIPFSAVVENFPIRNAKRFSDIPNLKKGEAFAVSVSGRKLNLKFNSDEMENALVLALTANYC